MLIQELFVLSLWLCNVIAVFPSSTNRPIQLDDHTGSLNFLMHGDWGWNTFNQTLTAYEMGVYAWIIDAKFVLALGDNFYDDGVSSVTDSLWQTDFHDIYASDSLNVPWYAILGNHDYHGSIEAQVQRTFVNGETMWTMPETYYYETFDLPKGGTMSIVFIDTCLLDPYQKDTELVLSNPQWQEMRQAQLEWIDSTLEELSQTATWLVVAGHYPIYSIGEHGDDTYLIADLLPILLRHKVHAYFTAHDHNHQHFEIDGLHHFVTGNSAGRGPFGPHGWQNEGLSKSTNYMEIVFMACGFSFVEVNDEHLNVSFVDNFGRVRYTESLSNPSNGLSDDAMFFSMFSGLGLNPALAGVLFLVPVLTVGIFAILYMGRDSVNNFVAARFVPKPKITLDIDNSTRSSHGLMNLPVYVTPQNERRN